MSRSLLIIVKPSLPRLTLRIVVWRARTPWFEFFVRCASRAARNAGSCLCAFSRRNPLAASCMADAIQCSAIEADRHRFTLRQTRRTVLMTFSTMLVQASARRSSFGRPSRVTVRISSRPSRMLADTPGASCYSRLARLRINLSNFSASSNSQAWRSTRRTVACNGFGSRSMMLRAL